MISCRLASIALAGVVAVSAVGAPAPASADGAASTRNIIFGAAAIGGTLFVVNHNRKVHEKYAEFERRQLEIETERNQAQAAYRWERSAYVHELAVARSYRKQLAFQRSVIHRRDLQIGSLKHSLIVAKYGTPRRTAYVQVPAQMPPVRALLVGPVRSHAFASPTRHVVPQVHVGPPRPAAVAERRDARSQTLSYGWGSF